MIASAIPGLGTGHNLPYLFSPEDPLARLCLLANLNSLVFDFVARQKIGGNHLTFFYVEQLPTLPPDFYGQSFHGVPWESLIAPRTLELSYTCTALEPMARACGFDGLPFAWDPARRRILRAQLDALFFLAYGFDAPEDEADIAHIQGTFPILNDQDPAYAALVLGHVRAYRAGAFQAHVAG